MPVRVGKKNKYYVIQELLSKNRMFYLSIGVRRIGKTYSSLCFLINRAKKKGENFVYLCRTKEELKELKDVCGDVRDQFPEDEIIQKGKTIYCNGKEIGCVIALSSFKTQRRKQFHDYYWILFDEFLQAFGAAYLPDEPTRLDDLIYTVFARKKGCHVIMLSNATSYVNPYFESWGILPDRDKRWNLYRFVAVEFPRAKDYYNEETELTETQEYINSKGDYAKFAHENMFGDVNDVKIERRTRHYKYMYTVIFGSKLGIYKNPIDGKLIFSEKVHPTCKQIFAMRLEDMSTESNYKGWYSSGFMKELTQARDKNLIVFETIEVREKAKRVLKKLGLY